MDDSTNTSDLKDLLWSFDPSLTWQCLVGDELEQAFKMWRSVSIAQLPADANIYVMSLPFYSNHKLYCLRVNVEGEFRHCFMLYGQNYYLLNGTSPPIHQVNTKDPINITAENAQVYLRFFCSFVYGDKGPFLPIEDSAKVKLPTELSNVYKLYAQKCKVILKSVIKPIELVETTPESFFYSLIMLYDDKIFMSKLKVHVTGLIEMLEEKEIAKDIPHGMLQFAPETYEIDDLLIPPKVQISKLNPKKLKSDSKNVNSTHRGRQQVGSGSSVIKRHIFNSDREITNCYISTLIRHALENNPQYDVITDFNKTASTNDSLTDFSKFVMKHGPVVLIESDFPYIEELLADLVVKQIIEKKLTVKRIYSDSRLGEQESGTVMILSTEDFDHGVNTQNLDRLAFEISMSKHPVFIGTNHAARLNNALLNVVEFKITIPKLNNDLFKILFSKILGGNLPRTWKKSGTKWLHYLTAHDFHQPCKGGLSGARAFNYLQVRIKNRLQSVESENSPNLQDLHGMSEAKQIAEDLISDIQSALKGELPWSAVDRGMLIAGPPGTGKTTIAKAIAKACGVRFIAVSAATWQSAGNMSEHLRAMHASFSEARNYAPSILFIDEVDSFGSRESFSGPNANYTTEIVNALLAEIQGFDTQQPVFVIGATNFPHKVDPALRRAGRLDKLVYIPHPNVEALTSIYEYYLSNKELVLQKSDDIDTKFLGGMSFGVTGADVESYVRGAVRRARKDQKPLCQQHLIDEITGKSRSNLSTRLSKEDMYRVAIHESGHAVLQILTGNQQVAYVSIVPRDNGSLGFVANMPNTQSMRTRKQYLETLQVVLAGRAAEEIAFGKDNVSSGAGGESPNSDLAIATRLATNLVCSMGMGKTATLIWGTEPSYDQQSEIEKLLQEAYSTAIAKLEAHKKSLEALANALVEKQELLGDEVLQIIGQID